MKCPNCGKEALFVNGKYVCVDCGIEITPEQQAYQNQANDQTVTADADTVQIPPADESIDTLPPETTPVNEGVTAPLSTPEPVLGTESGKPVQQYYENALGDEDTSGTETADKKGVYDFDKQPESSGDSQPVTPEADMTPTGPESAMPETTPATPPESTPEVPESTSAPTEEPTYFAPNTFGLNQVADVPAETPVTEPPTPAAEIPVTPVSLTETEVTSPELPPVTTPENISNEPETKSLDEMLRTETTGSPAISSPVSAYGPVEPESVNQPQSADNKTTESAIPSVESVFGSKPDSGLPTAQDFGVAPPQKAPKKKIPLPIFIAAGVILLITILGVVFALSQRQTATVYPITLTESDSNLLSSTVSTAMQQPQGISTDYNLSADYSGLTVKEDAKDRATIQKIFTETYNNEGVWRTDKDGDISTETSVGTVNDKRTYLAETSQTFVFSDKTQKYPAEAGQNLVGVPLIFGAVEKSTVLYTTNITKAVQTGVDNFDNTDYKKYQLSLDPEFIKEVLSDVNPVFASAEYQSVNTDNLATFVWIDGANKIGKITVSGDVTLETNLFGGKITLQGEAVYQYLDVSISDPNTPTEATKNSGTSVLDTKTGNEEEVDTSSVNSSPKKAPDNQLIEAKG